MKLARTSRLELHPLAEIVPRMRPEEWQGFLEDVRERGLLDPLRVANDGRTVLDGRHRLRAAQELGLSRVLVEAAKLDGRSELDYMFRSALVRRHLSDDQRAMMAARLAEVATAEARRDRAHVAAATRWRADAGRRLSTPEHGLRRPRTGENLAQALGVSTYKARRAAALRVVAPELADQVASGELKLREAESRWERQRSLRALAALPEPTPSERAAILTGDFRQLRAQIADESVDLVFTDPPYQESALLLWREMARMARRVLKPGSFLIAYSGHLCLPQVIEILGSELDYYWQAIIPFKGPKPSIHERQVRSGFRVVLIYVKPPVTWRPWFFDVVGADSSPDKRFHDWGQSVKPARYFVSRFSKPGEVVLDPFCGAGAFPVAAVMEGRQALGIELDPAHAEVASKRAALAEQELGAGRDQVASQNPFRTGEGDGHY
ncbi:MAG: DNA methyltransferase [Candidatus Dormibacterales bacterium]